MATCISYEIMLDKENVVAKDRQERERAVPVVKFNGSATGERSREFAARLMALAAEFHDPHPSVRKGE